MIRFLHRGDFKNSERFLNNALKYNLKPLLDKYGQTGVQLLASATPVKSGETARSWIYTVGGNRKHCWISWENTNRPGSTNVAILLQYGHGTGTGGFVQGRDYINPAIQPLFDRMAEDLWREVTLL